MRQIYKYRDDGTIACPIVMIIDEAQELFRGSGELKRAMGNILGESIRRGRSRNICHVVAVQAAREVPSELMNNLNSRIILRHKDPDQLRAALPGASPEQLGLVLTLAPGEALVDLFGATALIHCQLRRSPFKLTKLIEDE